MTTPEAQFAECFERMYELCSANGWGDPFSYARSREIHLANKLGHKVAPTLSGADAIDEDGECEYKTTINEVIQATYNGISKQATWEEQVEYLHKNKICKYKNHYYARYKGPVIVEVWKMDCEKVLEHLLPKLEKQFHKNSARKDPRLGVTIPHKYIRENAKLLYYHDFDAVDEEEKEESEIEIKTETEKETETETRTEEKKEIKTTDDKLHEMITKLSAILVE